jgi:leucyl aminopeptidase
MSVIKKLAPRLTVVALIPATENMPGGNAIRPGDVITHYGGRTSEVLNTDAEGRLVLGDALVRGLEEEPDAIVDIATLTGGMVVALGQRATGFFANDDGLAEELNAAADDAGELLWRMPLYDEYRKDLDSEVADIKNSGPRWGSPIIAALFLKDFVPDSVPWAHLDIAGPARSESDRDELNKGGTGVGTRTLLRWVEKRAHG